MEAVDYFIIYFFGGIILCVMLFFAINDDLDIERSFLFFISILFFYPLIFLGLWIYYILKLLINKNNIE
jgi:hypothetical protein